MKLGRNVWRRRAGLLALAVLLAGGNLVFFIWYRSTAQDRQQALDTRRGQLVQEVESAQAEAARLSAQRERLSQVSSAIGDFYAKRVGPRRETLAPTVDDLHDVLERVGVKASEITYTIAPVPDLPLTEMKVGFGFRNDYGKFKQLLAAFESDRRWIVVKEVTLSRDADLPGGVQVRVSLSTYFSGEPSARPHAAAAKGRR